MTQYGFEGWSEEEIEDWKATHDDLDRCIYCLSTYCDGHWCEKGTKNVEDCWGGEPR